MISYLKIAEFLNENEYKSNILELQIPLFQNFYKEFHVYFEMENKKF